MTDLTNNIRLAVDSGKVAFGINSVTDSLRDNRAKLVVAAKGAKQDTLQDIAHQSKISAVRLVLFEGNSMELGAVCGKPFSVSVLSIIDPGNSKILEEKQ